VKNDKKPSKNREIIKKFVIESVLKNNPYFWGREGSLCKRLITQYGEDFMLWLPLPNGSKIESLLWLSTKEGHLYIKSYLLEYKKQTTNLEPELQKVILSDKKIGNDILLEKKPKTLKEFLKMYE
jgi:hypothetical protein